jgi:hypothetical protein
MADPIDDALQNSKDPKKVRDAACALAQSKDPAQQSRLLALLKSPAFLTRMDSDEKLRGNPWTLGLSRVLDDLADNPAGHPSLVTLAGDAIFTKERAHSDLLIMACAKVRPAPPSIIRFWDTHWQPDDGYTNLTIDAVTLNGTDPALQLLATKLADTRFPEEDRKGWMRGSILIHRNDLPLLKMCDAFLKGNATPSMKIALIEVLFDYQPEVWFPPATVRKPPPRPPLAKEPATVLISIGQYALDQLKPAPDLELKIRATMKAVEPKN